MALPNCFQELSVDHVEFYVGDAIGAAAKLAEHYGFTIVGSRTVPNDHISIALCQGPTVFVMTKGVSDQHPASLYVQRHGDGVADIALRTPDAAAAFHLAVSRGARPVTDPCAVGGFVVATIGAFGDVTHTFLQRPPDRHDNTLPGFGAGLSPSVSIPLVEGPAPQLREVDHFAVCLEAGSLGPTVEFYETALGFEVTFEERIAIGTQAMLSQVVQSPSRAVTFTLIEPDPSAAAGQIDDFLKDHGGPGVQHVALRSDNIVSSVSALNARNVDFLQTPPAYYELLSHRLNLSRYAVDQLRCENILVDEDHDGQLFQIFARSTHPRRTFFYEVIERLGARTFGSGNIRALYEAVEAERARVQDVL